MDSATDRKVFLLEESNDRESCRSRQKHNPWLVLCILFVILSAVFAVAFVGGDYLGKSKRKSEIHESQDSIVSYPHRAYSVHYDGNSRVIPAFRGIVPVENFIQPRIALVSGQLKSIPGNPLLTPKGTSQIFIYQYRDEVSFIVTATGQNYGEQVSNASMSGKEQYTLTTSGLEGDLVQMTDGYHQLYDRISIPNSLAIKLQWGDAGSHGYIFVLRDAGSVDATISFSKMTGSRQRLNIRGCYQYDTEITDLPTPNSPLRVSPYNGQFSLHNEPYFYSETPIAGFPESSNLKLTELNSNSRRRRSMTTRVPHGIAFVLSHPDTQQVLHRIELIREERHGGEKGSVCWNVRNNVDLVEASFCPLFHRALYNGMSDTPSDNASHIMLINTHYRLMNNDSNSQDTWNHTTLLVHDIDSTSVQQKLHGRHGRSINRQKFFDVLHNKAKQLFIGVTIALKRSRKAVEDKINSVRGRTSRRKLLQNCDLEEYLVEGGKCLSGGVACGTDLASTTFDLDTAFSVADCASAISDCADFGSRCF